jgi:hypothetical protein
MTRRWWPFALVVLAYAPVALQQVQLPGVYMDAVNPDYLAVKILNRHAEAIGAWLLPGNYLLMKYPVLISFYHGSQQVWLGLPFFWLFGTTVTGLRLTHAMFALGVLFWMYAYLGRSGLKPWQTALACAALAIDPGFSYAFRTQSYITLAPMGWLFLALWALVRSGQGARRPAVWWLVAGLCYGLAVFGYFVYAFFVPALVLALLAVPKPARSGVAWAALFLGMAIGGSGYLVGYWLLIEFASGTAGAWDYFQQTQRAIHAFSEQPDLATRLAHAATMLGGAITNWYHHALIFGEQQEVPGAGFKTALLAGAPLLLWLRAEWKRTASSALRLMVALAVSYLAVALSFGTRLSGHHFVVLLPILYAALALALAATSVAWRSQAATVALPFAALFALNVGGQVKEALRLHETRGVGLYSDAINRLAADLDRIPGKPFVYFPDWGLSMPVAFLTRGRVGLDTLPSYDAARHRLCNGRDVLVAIVTGDRAARIEEWRQKLQWDPPTVVPYTQADGKVVFEVARFRARPEGC